MKRQRRLIVLGLAVAGMAGAPVLADSLTGGGLALKSGGSATLSSNGYVGTYLTVSAGGATVNFTVNASEGAGSAAPPHMNISIADTTAGFAVTNAAATDYTTGNVALPAGTYFVRVERDYSGNTGTSRGFTVNSLNVNAVAGSASFSNTSTDANALAAANTYIANFRQGAATVAIRGPGGVGLLPGTPVPVNLARHAFNFGGTITGFNSNADLASNPPLGSTAYNFQQFVRNHFNTVVPSNGGKWAYNEATQNVVTMSFVDQILNFAQSNNLRARMHNVIWGSGATGGNQQPNWVNSLISSAAGGNATAKANLATAITNRIGYYVGTSGNRAQKYIEIDGLNESLHNPSYWNIYGASGIASIYNQIAQAATAAGAPAERVYLNEYNVLQFSPASISSTGAQSGWDPYANWYRNNVEAVRNAGGAVGGIGVQYYADARTTLGTNVHSAAMINQALQNLSVEGLPISLTEFGLASGTSQTDGARIMEDTMRMVFGTPNATTFLQWGWFADPGQAVPVAALIDSNTWTLTTMGQRYEQLMSQWDTSLTATADASGAINFTGFYGDYWLRGQNAGAYDLTTSKGTGNYSISMAAPPTWSLWNTGNSGAWGSAGNWSVGGVASGAGMTAYFGPAAAGRTVNADVDRTLGMLVLDSAGGYTITGPGTLTMQGFASAHAAAIRVVSGSHTISAPVQMGDDTVVDVAAGSVLTTTALRAGPVGVTKTGAGTWRVNAVQAGSLAIDGGSVQVIAGGGAAGESEVGALTIAAGASLDVSDNRITITDGSAATMAAVMSSLASAYDQGRWDGAGLTSSTAAGDLTARTGLGVLDSGSSIVVRYTWYGDANLDGRVNADDYALIDRTFARGGSGASWADGDFNYDGVVNAGDYLLIDRVYLQQSGGAWAGLLAEREAQFGPGYVAQLMASVPEPAGAAMGALLVAAIGRRRRGGSEVL